MIHINAKDFSVMRTSPLYAKRCIVVDLSAFGFALPEATRTVKNHRRSNQYLVQSVEDLGV